MKLEIIATTLKEAIDIEKFGGDRIELVTGMAEGGLTPSLGLINEVCNNVNIPVMVMLRPHGKSFVYDEHDFKVILKDLEEIKKTKAKGIVFGSLNDDLTINEEQLKLVIKNKGNLSLTFHRAIDASFNPLESLKTLLDYEIDTVLTSGGPGKALDNYLVINEMINLTKDKIVILAGSGLNPDNIQEFLSKCNALEVHMGSGVKYDFNNDNEISKELIERVLNDIK